MPSPVLLLSEDAEAISTIRAALSRAGHRLTTTADPDAALRFAADFDLVILDHVSRDPSALEVCRELRSSPELAPIPVLGIAPSDDVDERVHFLSAGADDVMAKPFDIRELEARTEALLLRREHAQGVSAAPPPVEPAPAGKTSLFVFFSPKGGVGTTTLAVNVAILLAERKQGKVAILDLDLQWGQVASHLNIGQTQPVVELSRDPQALADPTMMTTYAHMHDSGLAVYGGATRPDQAELVTADHIGRLLSAMAPAYDTLVVDAGSVLDERTLTIFSRADKVVVPIAPDVPALRALASLLEMLYEAGDPAGKLIYVLNELYEREMLTARDIEGTLQAKIALEIPHDPLIYLRAVNEGEPLVRSSPKSGPAERIGRLATILVTEGDEAGVSGDGRKGRLAGLLRR